MLARLAVAQGCNGRVTAQQVVEAGSGDELAAPAHCGCRLQVDQRQFVIEQRRVDEASVVGCEPGEQFMPQVEVVFDAGDARHDGRQLSLPVDRTLVVGLAIEMDGEARNAGDGLANVDQAAVEIAVREAQRDAASKAEIAIEPRIEQRATVNLDAELPVTLRLQLRPRLDFQARAVGVRTDHPHAAVGKGLVPGHERDQSRAVARDIVTAAGLQLPAVALVERLEACRVEQSARFDHGMKRGRRCIDVAKQAGVELCLIHGMPRAAVDDGLDPHAPSRAETA